MLVALAAVAALWASAGASACACGDFSGPVVARGKSLYGVPWRVEAWHVRRSDQRPAAVEAHFSVGPRGSYRSVGYFVGLSSPLPKAFIFTATAGSEVDDHPEGDLSGIARRRVAKLIVTMRDGSQLVVHPRRAPAHLLRSRPWLRGLRFFDVFFPADQEPRLVAAYGSRGGLLARHHLP